MAIVTEETIIDDNGVQQVAHPQTESAAITDATSLSRAIIQAEDAATILTKLGASIFMQDVLAQAAAGDVLSKLGISEFVKSVLAGADATEVLNDVVPKGAASHNGFYRGKDITANFEDGSFSKAVAAGTFDDIFPGDYIVKSPTVDGTSIGTEKFLMGDLNYELYAGDTMLETNHVCVVPQDVLNVNTRMNSSNITTGGYVASEMWTTTIPKYVTAIQNAFGSDHVLKHREILTTAISASAPAGGGMGWTGSASDFAWQDVTVNLMNENMVYGSRVFGCALDTGERTSQLALFRLDPTARIAGYRNNRTDRKWYWLTTVASASYFAACNTNGNASYNDASFSDAWSGIRPHFLLY